MKITAKGLVFYWILSSFVVWGAQKQPEFTAEEFAELTYYTSEREKTYLQSANFQNLSLEEKHRRLTRIEDYFPRDEKFKSMSAPEQKKWKRTQKTLSLQRLNEIIKLMPPAKKLIVHTRWEKATQAAREQNLPILVFLDVPKCSIVKEVPQGYQRLKRLVADKYFKELVQANAVYYSPAKIPGYYRAGYGENVFNLKQFEQVKSKIPESERAILEKIGERYGFQSGLYLVDADGESLEEIYLYDLYKIFENRSLKINTVKPICFVVDKFKVIPPRVERIVLLEKEKMLNGRDQWNQLLMKRVQKNLHE